MPKLLEIRRGPIVESRHHGAIVAVEPDGRIVAHLGDEGMIVSTRSTIKPIQAIPLITSGAADRFRITSRELAVICSSHEGEPIHTETVEQILTRIGLGEAALRCGAHRPFSELAAAELEGEGIPFTQLHNNCSGKHSGMLTTAVHLGVPVEDYVNPEHPIQQAILSVFSRIAGLGKSIPIALDGCSAPTFGVPLVSLALAFSRLANPWSSNRAAGNSGSASQSTSALPSDDSVAAKWIVAAMTSNPEMVGGTVGRLDTDLMRAARGTLVSKVGAEAVHAIGVLPNDRFPTGLGIAIKIEDGGKRALDPVVVEALLQLGVIGERERLELAAYHQPDLENHRKVHVGEVRATFDLRV